MTVVQPNGLAAPTRIRRWVFLSFLALAVLIGFFPRLRLCSICDVQGPIDLAWYGLPFYSVTEHEFDEYGTMALWEDLYGKRCSHEWHYRARVALFLEYEYGAPLTSNFSASGGYAPHGIEALAYENKDWAITAWDSLRVMREPQKAHALSALRELGGQWSYAKHTETEFPKHYAVYWWKNHGKLFE